LGFIVVILFSGVGVNTQGAFAYMASYAYSREFEAEADYVGMYFAVHAGVGVSEAPTFWRGMAVAHPGSIKANNASSHPATPARFVALKATAKEIHEKFSR